MSASADSTDALSDFLVTEGTVEDALRRLVGLAQDVAGADVASISLLASGRDPQSVVTGPVAAELDEVQYRSDRGPCLDSYRVGVVIRTDCTATAGRWPEFSQAAAGRGIRSVLSAPVWARDQALGALNLYAGAESAFAEATVTEVDHFARRAALVLANTLAYWDARVLNENLRVALESRETINYAVGIILAGGGKTPEEAFQVLVRASQRQNRKLREIAAEMVERTSQRPQSR